MSGTTLTQAIGLLLAEARQTRLFTSGRAGEYEKAGRLFVGWLGRDPDVAEVTPALAGGFREALRSYPLNASKRAAYRELSVPERLAKSRADQDTQTLSPQTSNGKYLDPLRQVFDWAKKTGRVAANPFVGITVSLSKGGSKRRRRDNFDVPQLQALFSAPLFTGSAGERGEKLYQAGETRVDDWRYWLPLIALFSGARLNELCGLRLADFDQIEGVPFFHIRALAADQSLKTAASERIVPIHKALLELGLLIYVDRLRAAGEKRLFPSLQPGPRGHLSHQPSKFFGRLIDRMVGEDSSVVFHSFRHTFITKMREAGVAREVRTALVGHEDDSTHEGYGTEPMTRLNAGIQAVEWKGLDLAPVRLNLG
ncbi:integrase [Brevundimonas sp. 1080]|uniref:site-specific integrase n=1 Tax=Brevundimonas sp. 1080 TaxID=3156405 RepID=UPI0033962311